MAVALSIVAIAYAALCVWLTVRIVNRKDRWAKRIALWLVAAYPISFLLMYLARSRNVISVRFVNQAEVLYRPLIWLWMTIEKIIGTR
jgi:hypothetical protein